MDIICCNLEQKLGFTLLFYHLQRKNVFFIDIFPLFNRMHSPLAVTSTEAIHWLSINAKSSLIKSEKRLFGFF
jgi:hypothetical protein